VTPEFRDDQDDVHHRNHRGYGSEYYINTTGRNDIRRCKVARDEANVYLFVETVDPITPQSTGGGWWMNCLIRDESSDAPGWEGYQFGLSNDNPSSGKLSLSQSTGGWNWISLGEVDTEISGNRLAVSIPRSLLGLPANSTFAHLTFKWTDNQQDNTADSWLLNGDAAPNARFRYRYWAGGGADTPVHGKTYRLINRNSLDVATPNGRATTSGIEIKTKSNQFGLNQKWTTFQLPGGQWVLFNAEAAGVNDPDSLLAIETPNASATDGELLKNSTYDGLDQQHWNLVPQGDGWYRIVNEATGQALSRNPVGMLAQTAAPVDFNQQWSFELVAPVDSGGKYRFFNRKSNLLADVDGHSMNPGTDMVQQAATGEWNQEWVVYGHGADQVQLVSEESRRPLESPNASTGADLTQGNWAADDLQMWEMRMAEPGFFQFVNAGSGHAMGVQGGSTVPGAKLVQQTYNASSTDQQWHLSAAKSAAAGLFLDTFATGDTADENQDNAIRQAGGVVIANYTETANHFSISGGKLKNLGPGGYLTMNANLADYLVGEDFELSLKLTVLDTTANWSSIYLTSANENERGLSRLGMYALGSGNATQVYVLYRGVGVRGIEVVTLDDLNTLFLQGFGQTFDRTAEHAIRFISTAGTGITNQYDFVVDGITVKSGLQYAFTEDTVRQIEIVGLSTVGGVYYDDIALRISPPGISYSSWADDNNLDGAYADRGADPDEDGMDNLLEYVLGGDPNWDDAAIRLPSYLLEEDGGSNVFKYVYNRRRDAFERGLHYGILLKDDLVEDVAWSNIYDTAEAGTTIIDSSFESVTNDVPTDGDKKFMGLEVVED